MAPDRLEKLLDLALATLKTDNDPKAEATLMILAEALKEAESLTPQKHVNTSLPSDQPRRQPAKSIGGDRVTIDRNPSKR